MKIGKHKELDLETYVDKFSSDTTSSSNEESSTSDNDSSIEVMGITIDETKRRSSLKDPSNCLRLTRGEQVTINVLC